jgi:2,4-dienoyl-CoA reductase-like NADH-dependent reductase (Old Yellow Enzyme family)/NADPH-dependent 2,4-dienoyl-CoA reductase/sulfur reductase-like enzyme
MSQGHYTHLLSPGRIGPLQLRNRIIVTAMGVSLAEADGSIGERILAFHEEQARGGAGLVIAGVCGVAWPDGASIRNQIALSDDRFIPGLQRLTAAVHAHGARFAAQLHHGGMMAAHSLLNGRAGWCPSAPVWDRTAEQVTDAFVEAELQAMAARPRPAPFTFRELTRDDIRLVVRQFAEGADRAKRAGADGVEIHAAHGYLLSSFISPKANRRTDDYGGPLENRVRILLEVIEAVRAAVGPDFAVWVKLDSQQFGAPDGIQLADAVRTARMAEAAGVDAVTVSSYHDVGKLKLHSESNIPHVPGWNLPAAQAFKQAVAVPVITSGRVEPEVADAKIAAGAFDFLAMGRKLLADPHLPQKLAAGERQAVRPCIYCYTCVSAIYLLDSVRCAVNADLAFEYQRGARQPTAPRNYVVVGGGPGGMEAALRLDAQGHKVVLLERTARLGGTLQVAALPYEPNERLLDWLRGQIAASRVEVRLNTPATASVVAALAPAAVLVATGARRGMPPIPGADQPHVLSGDDMRRLLLGQTDPALARKLPLLSRMAAKAGAALGLTSDPAFVRKATRQWMPLGGRVAIIGGELVGLELAEFLLERGRSVTVLEPAPRLGSGLQLVRRMRMLAELREHGASLVAGARNIRIEAAQVCYEDAAGLAGMAAADHVIVAQGATGDATVADELRAAGLEVHAFGDCTGVGYIEGAIRGAAEAVAALARAPE